MDRIRTGFLLKDHATPSDLLFGDREPFLLYEITLKIEMGLLFVMSALPPFLNSGSTRAIFNLSEKSTNLIAKFIYEFDKSRQKYGTVFFDGTRTN